MAEKNAQDYTKILGSITGTEVTIGTNPIGLQDVLVIKIGDAMVADNIADQLNSMSAYKNDFYAFKGDLAVAVYTVNMRGGEKFFEHLQGKSDEITKMISNAQAEATELARMPTLETDIGKSNFKLADSKYKIIPLAIKDGDFQLPAAVKAGALQAAKNMRAIYEKNKLDITKTREFAGAASLDGNSSTLTNEELASMLLAKSMSNPTISKKGETQAQFDGVLDQSRLKNRNKDPKVVAETAKQILGDNFGIKGGVDTTTTEGNKPYLEAVNKSNKTDRDR